MAAAKPDIDVSSILASARKSDLQFAMLQSRSGCVLQAHKSKSVDAMRKAAKSCGGGSKGAWGKMRLNGKCLVLTCETAPPGNFAKDVKKFFSDAGHNLRVEFVDSTEAAAVDEGENGLANASPKAQSKRAEKPERDAQSASGVLGEPAVGEDGEEQSESIGDMVGSARKRAVNFAWLSGSDSMVFRGHRKKKCTALVKEAKQAGGGPHGAWGQMSVSGKVITLTCIEAPPGTFERLARQQLKLEGLQYKIEIVVPSVDAPAGMDAGETQETERANDGSAKQNLDALQARYRDVFERIRPLLNSGDKATKGGVKKILGAYRAAVLRGDGARASVVLDALESRAEPTQDTSAPEPEKAAKTLTKANNTVIAADSGPQKASAKQEEMKSIVAELASFKSELTPIMAVRDPLAKVLQSKLRDFQTAKRSGDLNAMKSSVSTLRLAVNRPSAAGGDRRVRLGDISSRVEALKAKVAQLAMTIRDSNPDQLSS